MLDMIGGKNNGYPTIDKLRDDIEAKMKAPLPSCMMVCYGGNINDGLPWIKSLTAVKKVIDSAVYFGDKKAEALYFNDKSVETAFCNGKKVFDVYYVREFIV